MDIDYTVGEVELSYKPKFKKLHKVVSSEDAYRYLLPTYKEGTICYKEYFKVLFLNQASQILGYTLISEGGITDTTVDVRVILQVALLTNSGGIRPRSSPFPPDFLPPESRRAARLSFPAACTPASGCAAR